MCIVCKDRKEQGVLRRFSCQNGKLSSYVGYGRSFYLCKKCEKNLEDKVLIKAFSRVCKNKIKITDLETILNG